ncbi:MAG: hypothetical protein ACYTFH_05900 [Planctomycetota bacterium]
MSCLINGVAVVIRHEALESRYPGGVDAFLVSHEDIASCTDGEIVAVSPDSRIEAWRLVASLEADGLVAFRDGWAGDLVLVGPQEGPEALCDWLEFGRPTGTILEVAPSVSLVRRSPSEAAEIAIPRSVMNDCRREFGLDTDPRSADEDPIGLEGRPCDGDAEWSDENELDRFVMFAAAVRPASEGRTAGDSPGDGAEDRGTTDGGEGPRHSAATGVAAVESLDESTFLEAGGDRHELEAARSCLRLLGQDDPGPLRSRSKASLSLSSELTGSPIRGRDLALGYLHARFAKIRANQPMVVDLMTIDGLSLEVGTPRSPHAIIRLWACRPMPRASDASGDEARRVAYTWAGTIRLHLDGDHVDRIEIGRVHPPDTQEGEWVAGQTGTA